MDRSISTVPLLPSWILVHYIATTEQILDTGRKFVFSKTINTEKHQRWVLPIQWVVGRL